MGNYGLWSTQEDDFLRGNSKRFKARELASELNRTVPSVNSRILLLGLTKPRSKLVDISKETLDRLYHEEHLSMAAIGEKFGVCGDTVRYWFLKLGVSIKKQSEAQHWRHKLNPESEETRQKRSEWSKALWRDPKYREKKLREMRLTWEKFKDKDWGRKMSERRLGCPRLYCIVADALANEDTLFNFILKHPSDFGYVDVLIRRTSDYDLIGIKADATIERIEVEKNASDVQNHHQLGAFDRIIAYYKGRQVDALHIPVSIVDHKKFITFTEKNIKLMEVQGIKCFPS